MSSWARVNVVRSRRCFRVGIPKIELVEKEKSEKQFVKDCFEIWSTFYGERKFLSFCL